MDVLDNEAEVQIEPTSTPPLIDGRLDDLAWQRPALPTGEWRSYDPLHGNAAKPVIFQFAKGELEILRRFAPRSWTAAAWSEGTMRKNRAASRSA